MNADLAELLEALHPDAFGWALHCCRGDTTQAEDVLQNAYLKIAEPAASFDGRSSLKSWWFGVIRLTAFEEHRRHTSRQSLLARLQNWFGNGASPDPSPAVRVVLDEQAERLRRHLHSLSPRQAEVLHLVFYQGLSISEAASIMSVGVGSARQHYERGKTRLRELLQTELCDAK